jgi:isoleucyl-tRNA synthetase
LERFDAFSASEDIEKFVDDFSLWYIRRSRDRVGPASENEKDRGNFYDTTYYVLLAVSKLLAPFVPFLSEVIYKNLTKEESVHMADWPKYLGNIDEKLIHEMQEARDLVEKAHSVRKEKVIPVRQPLSSFSSTLKPISKDLEYLIKDEINVKNLIWNSKMDKLDTKITKELEEEANVRDLVRKIQDERKNLGLNLTQKANVSVEKIPQDEKLVNWMIKKAQIANLKKGKFKVTKAS